ncbi:MAG: hypothetical protein KAW92_09405 [Candidatus Cloacimonetes bacterium]|nr:hypothetical protein [Candidatus Cloacimonadota bacterium]
MSLDRAIKRACLQVLGQDIEGIEFNELDKLTKRRLIIDIGKQLGTKLDFQLDELDEVGNFEDLKNKITEYLNKESSDETN